jgi:hypothetical protein
VRTLYAGVIASLVLLSFSRSALADDEAAKARATALFAEAKALSDAGKHADACRKLEESVKAHAGVGNQYNLADCWETIGRTASAHALFLRVVERTRELGQAEREQAAKERADALAPKLTRLRVEVKAPPEGFSLTRNGQAVPQEKLGVAVPIDPGMQKLRASAPGKQAWSQDLDLPPDPGTTVVTVPELADEKKKLVAAAAPAAKKEPKPASNPPEEEESSGGFRTIATLSLLGIGIAGAIVGSSMGVQYATSHRDAEAICPSSVGCTDEEIADHDELVKDSETARTWMYVGAGAAAVGLGGAAILHFTAPKSQERMDAAWLGARVFVSRDGAITGALQGGF